MPPLLSCRNLGKTFGAQTLFSDISISFAAGERVGLIGPNGSGKSTLLKILAGREDVDHGEIFQRKHLKIVCLEQEDVFARGRSVEDAVVAGLGDQGDEAGRLNQARRVLSQAGFVDPAQPVAELSGGWLKKLAIARALARQPDLLLLDEPTNHLDINGILWLENILRAAPFAFVLVSHDRTFLDNTSNRIIELNRCYPQGFFSVSGNYRRFLEQRRLFLEQQENLETTLANKVRREVEWLRRGPKARATKARYRIDRAWQLQDDLALVRDRNRARQQMAVNFVNTGRKTKKLLVAKKISKKMGDRELFSDLSLELGPGTSLGLVGGNGCGKSTLMHIINGDLMPDSGTIDRAHDLRVVLFDQQRQQLDKNQTLRRALAPDGDSINYQGRTLHVVSWAKRFLFQPDQLDMPVSHLSGGEQARILIANLICRPADILLLDEPTNDLDISAIEVLEDSLLDFPGAIVLVSHDRAFLDNITGGIIGFSGQGTAEHFADYSQWLRAGQPQNKPRKKKKKTKEKTAGPKKLTFKEKLELDKMEENIQAIEEELELCKARIAAPEVMNNPPELARWCERLRQGQEKSDHLYERWEELEQKQETFAAS